MIKLGNTIIGGIIYDTKCIFDTAHDMCHWLDQYRKTTVCDVINELSDRGLLTKKGEKVCKALELLTGVRATNKGVPEKIIKFYKRFDNWADKNDIEI